MKKFVILVLLLISGGVYTSALTINEVMSNPVGDDSGREWFELYNNTDESIDLTALTISIKGGSYVGVTPVSGGVMISPHGYAIIGSTVSGATRFTQDYPAYSGVLFKSSISLVNTGVTSIDIKLGGVSVDSLPSYTAAKEGSTYSFIGGAFAEGTPTPGEENKINSSPPGDATTTPPSSQTTVGQSPPSADIVLYLPNERLIVAGAPALFSVSSLTHSGSSIGGMSYTWSFGDGGERTGATTTYRYFYPGRYLAQVEGTNGMIAGTARMTVKVVQPDISMSTILNGKYGSYIDITNPNKYDLDISGWRISIDGAMYSFPKNTLIAEGITHFPGATMGFASTTISSSTILKLLFPNMEEVVRMYQGVDGYTNKEATTSTFALATSSPVEKKTAPSQPKSTAKQISLSKSTATLSTTSSVLLSNTIKKDTRLASWMKSLFKW